MFRRCHFAILLLSYCALVAFCSQKEDICGYRSEKRKKFFTDTIKHIGIKLCELKCIENGQCLSFQYNIKALVCRLSSDESKRIKKEEGYIIIPRNYSSVSPGQCRSKRCLPTFRCLETRNGQAVCVRGWKQSYPGVTPQYRKRRTLKSKLHAACKEGDLKRVTRLLSHTRVNMNGRYGSKKLTPLLLTAFYGHRQVYDFLVSKGADVSLVSVDGGSILHAASEGGHEEMVKCVLLQNIVDINSRDKRGKTPVMRAVYCGHRDVYNLLVMSGADISLVDNTLRNILFLATGPGHVQIVQDILARDIVELNSRADGNITAIMLSAVCGRKEVYSLLMNKDADVLLVDDHGRNILHVACWGGHVQMVKYLLLQHIVDINSRDSGGNTPLMVAAYRGYRDVFDLLVNEGADVSRVNDHNRNVIYSACERKQADMLKYILSQNIADINSRDKTGATPVIWAAFWGRREVYDFLLSEGANVSLVAHDGRNILHSASEGGHMEMVKCVISQNIADINSRDKKGKTPLMVSAYWGHRDVFDLLVSKGADVTLVSDDGQNSLFSASEGGHVEMVKYILAQHFADINSRDKNGNTPLMVAAYLGHRDMFDLLVSKGADVTLVSDDGQNSLFSASEGGHVDMVKYILAQNIADINSRDKKGNTPLMFVAYLGHRDVFELLVSKGTDVTLVSDDGQNSLFSASRGGHVDMVKYILAQNIADINSRDKKGKTPLMVAAYLGHRKVYDFLVNEGADISLVAHDGRNILHSATVGGHVGIVKCVLSQNTVEINSRDKKGKPPLMLSAYFGHRDVFDLLVSEGADVSLVTDDGRNIIYSAVAGGHVDMVRYILSQNIVDINSRDKTGRTPVMWATCWGRREVYDFLVNEGADVSLVNYKGNNVLHIACTQGHTRMVKHILLQNAVDIQARNGFGYTPTMIAKEKGNMAIFKLLQLYV